MKHFRIAWLFLIDIWQFRLARIFRFCEIYWEYRAARHLVFSVHWPVTGLIIYMKKFLDCDWLREKQFLGNTVQKKGNLVQKRVTNVTFWLANKQRNSLRANQMRHLNGAKFGSAPDQFRAKTAMVGVCSTFAFATETTVEELKNYSKNENNAKSTVFGSLFRRIGA